MPDSYDQERRHARYVAHFEIHVAFQGRNLVTLTREISRSGFFFFADPSPPVGERVRATLYPDAHEPFGVDSVVRYSLDGVGAGVDITEADAQEAAQFHNFVEQQATSARAWRAIGGFVRSAEEGDTSADVDFEQKEVIDVGESGEAFRVFFERYPPVSPDNTELARSTEALAQAKQLLSGVSSEPVGIKLHAKDRLRRAHLGVLAKAPGFVAIVPPPASRGPHTFYALSGREQIVIKTGDRAVFPFFTSADLARIRRDLSTPVDSGLRRSISSLDVEGSVSSRWERAQEGKEQKPNFETTTGASAGTTTLATWTKFDESTAKILIDLFDILHAETRVYTVGGVDRPVRLLRNLTVMVREPGGETMEGTLLYDGRRLCAVFGMKTRDQMRVRPLTPNDEVRLPAW